MSTSGVYHEYIGGCSVHQRDTIMHVRDIMNASGNVQLTGIFNIIQRLLSICSPT